MSNKYTPTTDNVRYFYSQHTDDGIMGILRRQDEFDRWLASVKAETLKTFFNEMEKRNWSTSNGDVIEARDATLNVSDWVIND